MPSDVEKMLGLDGLFDGKLTHLSFDCPNNLRSAFKTESKSNSVSVCKNLQKFMASYVVTSRVKKHALGNTLAKLVDVPFVIENLNFEQYVQSRPRRLLRKKPIEKNIVINEKKSNDKELVKWNKRFEEVINQWSLHPSKEWRETWVVNAGKYPELENAQRVLELYQELEVC